MRSVLLFFLFFFCVVQLCAFFTFLVRCCDVRYDFHIQNDVRFDRHYLQFFCRRAHVLFMLFVVCLYPQFFCRRAHVLFMLFVVCLYPQFFCRRAHVLFMLFVVCLYPQCFCRRAHVLFMLFVVCVVVSNTNCAVCLFCLSSSCVYVASFSELSISNWPFGIL